MTNGVVLTAALRSNLLSLQQTQKDIDTHQNRLATGKKVNSALDNPQSFFAAQSLTNRANDLSNLLDSIGQSIQVINAANNGVSALTTLINQAQSVANTAQSTLAGSSTTALTTGNVSLNGATTWSTISGLAVNDVIKIFVSDPTGGTNKIDGTSTTQSYTVAANDTVNDVIQKINDLNTRDNLTTPAISAYLDANGHLNFNAVNGGTLSVQFTSGTANADVNNLGVANALGFAGIALANKNGNGTTGDIIGFTQLASSTLSSNVLYSAANTIAQASTLVSALKNSAGAAVVTAVATDTLKLTVGGKTSNDLLHYSGGTATTESVQNVIDAINHDTNVNSLISASFDATAGKIIITPLTASATDVQLQVTSAAAGSSYNLGFGQNPGTLATAAVGLAATEDIRFGAAAGTLASLQTQYNTVLSQINSLVGDTGYAGTNLLNGNNLTTYFNENRTSSLTTSGVTFNSSGLGLTTGNFQSSSSITTAINQTISALTTVRNFGSTLANNLSIIQNRQDFTNNLINTLKTGSDALTNADQNEEGASLLALQTRQSLGITSLSLASQAQQAILKLF